MFLQISVPLAVLFILSTSHAVPTQGEPKFIFAEVSGGGQYKVDSPALLRAIVTDEDKPEENDDWKFCRWTRLRDNAYCQFTYDCSGIFCDIGSGDFSIRTECTVQLANRINFTGEDPNYHNRICGMAIPKVTRDDSSVWKVEIEECKITGCGSSNGNDYVITSSVNVTVVG